MFYKSMAIVLSLSAGLQAMEVEEESIGVKSEQGQFLPEDKRIMIPFDKKEAVNKMWLIKQAKDKEELPLFLEDVRIVIGGKLHELYLYANPCYVASWFIQLTLKRQPPLR